MPSKTRQRLMMRREMGVRRRPHILVVSTGSIGGIGRAERLLGSALDALAGQGVLSYTNVARREHPAYLGGAGGAGGGAYSPQRFLYQLCHAVWTERPDLVLFEHVNLARAAPLARALGAPRFAVATYGIDVWPVHLDAVRQHALAAAASVFTISEFTAGQLARCPGLNHEHISVIPLALEPHWLEPSDASPRPQTANAAPRMLSVSRLDPAGRDKGVAEVIRALPAVRSLLPDVEYHVVGDGPDRPYLERLAADRGVRDSTVFHGLASESELRLQYRTTDVFVLPSLSEGFGLVFLEAMAHAKPVVARRAGATPEVVLDGTTGILIDDPQQLPQAVASVLLKPEMGQALGAAGLYRAREQFSFAAYVERLRTALLAAAATPVG